MNSEIKRQIIHQFFGVILALFILYQDTFSSIKLLIGLVLIMLLINWYYTERNARRISFKEAVKSIPLLPKNKREEILNSSDKFYAFEENLFNTLLKKLGIRSREKDPTIPPLYFFLSAVICLVFLGREITVVAIITLAVGDSLSAIVGKRFGKHKIFWSKKKSVEGSSAFFVSVFIAIYIFLHFFPSYVVFNPLVLALVAALSGTLIETEPTLIDNLSIPIFTGVNIYLLTFI